MQDAFQDGILQLAVKIKLCNLWASWRTRIWGLGFPRASHLEVQVRPSRPYLGPRTAQEASGMFHGGSKTRSGAPRDALRPPKMAQDAPKTPPSRDFDALDARFKGPRSSRGPPGASRPWGSSRSFQNASRSASRDAPSPVKMAQDAWHRDRIAG